MILLIKDILRTDDIECPVLTAKYYMFTLKSSPHLLLPIITPLFHPQILHFPSLSFLFIRKSHPPTITTANINFITATLFQNFDCIRVIYPSYICIRLLYGHKCPGDWKFYIKVPNYAHTFCHVETFCNLMKLVALKGVLHSDSAISSHLHCITLPNYAHLFHHIQLVETQIPHICVIETAHHGGT